MFKVRFHLAAGEHFMHWQIKQTDKRPIYIAPNDARLFMYGCVLKNNINTAKKIHAGANKTVCAWIECKEVFISKYSYSELPNFYEHVSYNPRVNPNWIFDGKIVDNEHYPELYTFSNKVYAPVTLIT